MRDILLVLYIDAVYYSIFIPSFCLGFYLFVFLSWVSHETCFCKCLWFIFPFDHMKYFQVPFSHFIRNIYFTNWIVGRITTTITPVHPNDAWIVMKFIRIQINKLWTHRAWLTINGYTLYSYWSSKSSQHQHQNNKRLLSKFKHLYSIL